MRVLLTIGGYLPAKNYGGPVVSISNMCDLLGDDLEIFILTVDHDINSTERFKNIHLGWNECGAAKVQYLKEESINYNTIKQIVDDIKPDLLYANSFFLAKFTLNLYKISKMNNIPILVAPRGELCIHPYNTKKLKKVMYTNYVKLLYRNNNIYYQTTSEEEQNQIRRLLSIKDDNILFLDNIPSIPKTVDHKNEKTVNTLNCVFLSRIHPKKNLLFAIEQLKKLSGRIKLDIYGNIEDVNYWEKCKKTIDQMPSNVTVNYVGTVSHEDVTRTFAKYDIMFFPTLSENYGHVIVEAMLSQCPVIISDNTPWSDINFMNAGWAITLNKPEEFVNVLQRVVNMDSSEYKVLVDNCKEYINRKLNISDLKQKYLTNFNEIAKFKNN